MHFSTWVSSLPRPGQVFRGLIVTFLVSLAPARAAEQPGDPVITALSTATPTQRTEVLGELSDQIPRFIWHRLAEYARLGASNESLIAVYQRSTETLLHATAAMAADAARAKTGTAAQDGPDPQLVSTWEARGVPRSILTSTWRMAAALGRAAEALVWLDRHPNASLADLKGQGFDATFGADVLSAYIDVRDFAAEHARARSLAFSLGLARSGIVVKDVALDAERLAEARERSLQRLAQLATKLPDANALTKAQNEIERSEELGGAFAAAQIEVEAILETAWQLGWTNLGQARVAPSAKAYELSAIRRAHYQRLDALLARHPTLVDRNEVAKLEMRVLSEARAKRQEALAHQAKSAPWYAPVFQLFEAVSDLTVGNVAYWGGGTIGFLTGHGWEWSEAGAHVIEANRQLMNRHLGGSIFGDDLEFADGTMLDDVGSLIPGAPILVKTGQLIGYGFEAIPEAYAWYARQVTGYTKEEYEVIRRQDGLLIAGEASLYVAEAAAGLALILATGQPQLATAKALAKPVAVAGGMSLASAFGGELIRSSRAQGRFEVGRFLTETGKGTAGSLVFMGAVQRLQRWLVAFNRPDVVDASRAAMIGQSIDALEATGDAPETIHLLRHAATGRELLGALLIAAVNVVDSADIVMASSTGLGESRAASPNTAPQSDGKLPELLYPKRAGGLNTPLVATTLAQGGTIVWGSRLVTPSADTAGVILASSSGISLLHVRGETTSAQELARLYDVVEGRAVINAEFHNPRHENIKPVADNGALGLTLVNPTSIADIRAFIDQAYFAPLGHRPLGPNRLNQFLDAASLDEMVNKLNDSAIASIKISSANAAHALLAELERAPDALTALRRDGGLRLVVLDRAALEASLATEGKGNAPATVIGRLEAAVTAAGLTLGATVKSRAEGYELAQKGYRYFVISSDAASLGEAFTKFDDVARDERLESPARGELSEPRSLRIRDLLARNEIVYAGFLMSPDLAMAKLLARRSHALWIDAEHGTFSHEQVVELIESLKKITEPVVRISKFEASDASIQERIRRRIRTYLDAGAAGIIAPSVESAAQARAFVEAVKAHNSDALAVVMIETAEGLRNAEAIASVPGIDIIHLGPWDLAQSLGVALGSDEHKAALAAIREAARANGVALGGLAHTRSAAYGQHGQGFRFLTTVSDKEAIVANYKTLFPFDQAAQVFRSGTENSMQYYHSMLVLKLDQVTWRQQADGAEVASVQMGPGLTAQLVRKKGKALVEGRVFEHGHAQGQLTIVLRGQAKVDVGGQDVVVSEGDMVWIPPYVPHRFTDIGAQDELVLVDLLMPGRIDGRPGFKP